MSPGRRRALGLAAAMLLAAVGAEWARPVAAARPAGPALDRLFPRRFADWQVDEGAELLVKPPSEQGKVHGIYDQVLERTYVNGEGARIMLLAAEGSEQSAGLQVHRPEVCYPGNGFKVDDLRHVVLHPLGRPLPGVRLHAWLPGRSEPITYWTVLGGQAMEDATAFRLRQLRFGLRRQLLDGMLVRLSSIDSDAQRAYANQARFAADLAAALPPESLSRVMGL